MITKFEVRYKDKCKSFNCVNEAFEYAEGLERVGYVVKIFVATYSLYAETKALVYQTKLEEVQNES